MKTFLKLMSMPKNQIPDDVLYMFENIVDCYEGKQCEEVFYKAMEEHLTSKQRYLLCEQHGSCNGTGYDKERKAFADEHADKPLKERLELFKSTFGRGAILNDDNTITVPFACHHGYYKHAPKGKFDYPGSTLSYFERCAGGRLYEYQKALGIKLKIKSVDVTPLNEHITNPVVFTFDIVG